MHTVCNAVFRAATAAAVARVVGRRACNIIKGYLMKIEQLQVRDTFLHHDY